MRSNRVFLVAWILLGLLVIKNILQMLYFPNSALLVIHDEFLPYSFIIEIIMFLICLGLIPGVYVLKKACIESEYINNDFFSFILMLSMVPLVFALLSTYLFSNIFFPLVLLFYGVLFSVLAYYLLNM